VKALAPVLGAGGAFVGCSLLGLAIGIFLDGRTGEHFYAAAGLFAGFILGGYAAIRLLLRSI